MESNEEKSLYKLLTEFYFIKNDGEDDIENDLQLTFKKYQDYVKIGKHKKDLKKTKLNQLGLG